MNVGLVDVDGHHFPNLASEYGLQQIDKIIQRGFKVNLSSSIMAQLHASYMVVICFMPHYKGG